MFDAAFTDVGGMQCASLFRFKSLMLFFGERCRFQMATLSSKASPVCRTKRERNANISSTC